jgi:hypothetical protein
MMPQIYHDTAKSPLKPSYVPRHVGEVVYRDYTDLAYQVSRIKVGDILLFNVITMAFEAVRVQKIVSNPKGSLKVVESNRVTSGSVDLVRVHWKYLGWIREIENEKILEAIREGTG